MVQKQPQQVAWSDPEIIGEIGDRGFFEESLLNEPHAPRDGGRRPIPCRASWRRFRSAAQAWPKARPLGGSRRGKEPNILGLCGSHPADRATIDAGCPHACEKHAVEGRVPRQARAIAGLPIEIKRQHGRHAHEVKGARWRPVDEIGLDRRITSDPGQNRPDGRINFPRMRDPSIVHAAGAARLYRGWLVVAAAFLVAMFGFGLGFYGPGIYLVALQARHGWSIEELSLAITVYYILGAALLFMVVGPLFDRWGARAVVTIGTVAMACGIVLLTLMTRPQQVYAGFAVMSLGWATMSGAAINILVAPWFERRRGLALSWAMNGGSAGGVVIAPVLVLAISRFGFAAGLDTAAAVMLAVLIPVAVLVLRPRHPDEHDPADLRSGVDRPSHSATASPDGVAEFRLATVLRTRAFLTTSIPFALALTAQVGFLTHQFAFLSPSIGTIAAGWAVGLTTFAAVVGRVATGFVVDRFDRRVVTSLNFGVQAFGMGLLAASTDRSMLYVGCVIFGIGVGNATTLPGLIVQQEFPKQHFARLISIVVAINQFTFAFGPTLLAQLQHLEGTYTAALLVCFAMEIAAAIVVVSPAVSRHRASASPEI